MHQITKVTLYFQNVTSPYRIQNLQNDTKYEIYVMALNRLGASPPSTSIVVDTERPGRDRYKIELLKNKMKMYT